MNAYGVASAEKREHVMPASHHLDPLMRTIGHQVALRPFMGIMGLPPAEPGLHSPVPPRATG